MCRTHRNDLYNKQPFPLTELGYGVQKIEAALIKLYFNSTSLLRTFLTLDLK